MLRKDQLMEKIHAKFRSLLPLIQGNRLAKNYKNMKIIKKTNATQNISM